MRKATWVLMTTAIAVVRDNKRLHQRTSFCATTCSAAKVKPAHHSRVWMARLIAAESGWPSALRRRLPRASTGPGPPGYMICSGNMANYLKRHECSVSLYDATRSRALVVRCVRQYRIYGIGAALYPVLVEICMNFMQQVTLTKVVPASVKSIMHAAALRSHKSAQTCCSSHGCSRRVERHRMPITTTCILRCRVRVKKIYLS